MRIKAYKAVRFDYTPSVLTLELLRTFRDMVNEAIRICVEEDAMGRLRLRNRIYKEFQTRFGVQSGFPYSVAEVAWSIVRKHRKWRRKPYARRLMMKMDIQNYSLNHRILSLPFRKGERVLIPLEYGDYQSSFLDDHSLKRGSVTITESGIMIAFSRVVPPATPKGLVGIDINEKSVVCSDGSRIDLSQVVRLRTEYDVRRTNFNRKHAHDRRVRRKFDGSRREKQRIRQILHRTARRIVEAARNNGNAIVLEQLKNIRQMHRRGNGEGRSKRGRISKWPFRTLQSFIAYKAAWEGVSVEFVSAAWTSRICHRCGYLNHNLKLNEREWPCPNCGALLDRDLNAAINIQRRGTIGCLGEVRPGAHGTDEAMKGNEATKAPILQAEALKLPLRRDT